MYERAWAAEPQNEEFGTHVFNGLIRDFNFPKQQQVHTQNSRYRAAAYSPARGRLGQTRHDCDPVNRTAFSTVLFVGHQ